MSGKILRYFIVDDDTASRTMLKRIIAEGELGLVIGEAESGVKSITPILTLDPDVVLIDLLMPELDGMETIDELNKKGYQGKFIMISQIVNKEMVGEAYEKGIEFFIHKPINRVEVQSILKKTTERIRLKDSLLAIKESLAKIDPAKSTSKKQSIKEIILSILSDMGIIGEVGSNDIIAIIQYLVNQEERVTQLPPLKDLYRAIAKKTASDEADIKKESKAIEQRLRRTILLAVNNLASLGAIDYTNPEFEHYGPRYFDFQELRTQIFHIQAGQKKLLKVKINNKKFLQVLYLEVLEKYKQN